MAAVTCQIINLIIPATGRLIDDIAPQFSAIRAVTVDGTIYISETYDINQSAYFIHVFFFVDTTVTPVTTLKTLIKTLANNLGLTSLTLWYGTAVHDGV